MSGAPGIVSRAGRANTEEHESTERVEVAEEQQGDRELNEREGEEEAKDKEVSYYLANDVCVCLCVCVCVMFSLIVY